MVSGPPYIDLLGMQHDLSLNLVKYIAQFVFCGASMNSQELEADRLASKEKHRIR